MTRVQRRRGPRGGATFLVALLLAVAAATWRLDLLPEDWASALPELPTALSGGQDEGRGLRDVLDAVGPWFDSHPDVLGHPVPPGPPGVTSLPEAPAADHGDGYVFLAVQPGGSEPVGYDPCRPVEVVVNPEGAPEGHELLVETAVTRVSRATGLDLRLVGTTDDRRVRDRGAGDPVLVLWAGPDEVPELQGRTAGIGGSTSMSDGRGPWRYVTGIVVLDADDLAGMPDAAARQAVVDHEFGHLVGLGHVDDPGQLMHASMGATLTFQDGDLAGMQALGGLPCD